jgi:hypothetical protein
MNLTKCRRCGQDIKIASRHATNKRFCCKDCYDTWWNEFRSKHVWGAELNVKLWGPAPKVELTEPQRAWLAALIDGEGWIGVVRERRPRNKSGWNYKPTVEIVNCNRQLLNAALECASGYSTLKHNRLRETNHRQTFSVRFNQRAIAALLEQIKPYLIVKRKQAELVIALCRLKETTPMRTSQNADMFEALRGQIRALNRRGTSGG